MTLWTAISWALLLAAGFLAAWAVLSDPARGRLRCPGGWRRILYLIPIRQGCWYDMSSLAAGTPAAPAQSHRCPECGRVWTRSKDLSRRRTRWSLIAVAAAVALLAYPASVIPRVQKHGWWAGVPTWALVLIAPVDEYVSASAAGPGPQPPGISAATDELLNPAWDRPFHRLEMELFCSRLNAAARRLHDRAGGPFIAFIPSSRVEAASWWNWPAPLSLMHGFIFGNLPVDEAMQLLLKSRAGQPPSHPVWSGRRGPIRALGGDRPFVQDWLALLDSLDRATPDGYKVRTSTPPPGAPTSELIAYDVSDLSPPRLVPVTRAGPRQYAGAQIQFEVGDPQPDQEIFRVERIASRVAPTHNLAIGAVRGVLWVRASPEHHAMIVGILQAVRAVIADPSTPQRGIDVGLHGSSATLVDLSWLPPAPHPTAPDPPSLQRALFNAQARLEEAMHSAATTPPATADAIRSVIILIGTPAQLAAAEAELQTMRTEAAAQPNAQTAAPTP